MPIIRGGMGIRRNEKCPCGSGKKYKHCHSPEVAKSVNKYAKSVAYIDEGEQAVRYVICDSTGVKFFSDKDNNILVFATREDATAIALLEEFADQAPGEINVAGVGETKWARLQEKLPFVEIKSVEHAANLIKERISAQRAKLESMADETPEESQENNSPRAEDQQEETSQENSANN